VREYWSEGTDSHQKTSWSEKVLIRFTPVCPNTYFFSLSDLHLIWHLAFLDDPVAANPVQAFRRVDAVEKGRNLRKLTNFQFLGTYLYRFSKRSHGSGFRTLRGSTLVGTGFRTHWGPKSNSWDYSEQSAHGRITHGAGKTYGRVVHNPTSLSYPWRPMGTHFPRPSSHGNFTLRSSGAPNFTARDAACMGAGTRGDGPAFSTLTALIAPTSVPRAEDRFSLPMFFLQLVHL
jgi:hypothetical protein